MANNQSTNKTGASWVLPIILAIGLVVVIRAFLFSPMIVDGPSMEPTLHDRERIIVSKTIGWIGEVRREDIIIIKGEEEETNFVKRTIGLPGDIIEMRDDQLYINDELVDEPYLEENRTAEEERRGNLTEDFAPLQVPDHHYFVMGDNRVKSIDSRSGLGPSLGFIEEKRIIGKSKFVLFPLENMRPTK